MKVFPSQIYHRGLPHPFFIRKLSIFIEHDEIYAMPAQAIPWEPDPIARQRFWNLDSAPA
jgi:hypothetical protein